MSNYSTVLVSGGKRVRIDGTTSVGNVVPRTLETRTTGNGEVSNPRVDLKFLVPAKEGLAWTHQIGDRALTFCQAPVDDADRKERFFNGRFVHRPDENNANVLDIIHTNADIAKWYIDRMNTIYEERRLIAPGAPGALPAVYNLSDLEDPKESLNFLARRWKLAGVNFTAPASEGAIQDMTMERQIGTYIRCDDIIRHYWGCGVKGGDYCFILLRFVKTSSARIAFPFSRQDCWVAGEFKAPVQVKYVPQLVAVRHYASSLPANKRIFKMDEKIHFGREFLVGVMMKNPAYKFQTEPIVDPYMPIMDRANEALDKRSAPEMNLLVHS